MPSNTVLLGDRPVHRIGFGAMQLPGPGVLGPPADRSQALRILRHAVEAGVNHIDTAQFYGPAVANQLIHDALHPYPEGLVIVSKVGADRDAEGNWLPAQRPAELRRGVEENLRTLALDCVPVVNLRRHPDGAVPLDEQLDAMIAMRTEGLIGAIGLSNVTLDEYLAARAVTEVACVQNAYNLADRSAQPLFDACRRDWVPWVPFFPLGSAFGRENPVLGSPAVRRVATRHGITPSQVALAWLLAQHETVLLIPGTSSLLHLEENLAAADVSLSEDDLALLTT